MTTIEPLESEKANTGEQLEVHIPFDGFVNVNDIIKERRSLRNAIPDHAESDMINSTDDIVEE